MSLGCFLIWLSIHVLVRPGYANSCKWKAANAEEECRFPFAYQGNNYYECASLMGDEMGLWCSTQNDADARLVTMTKCEWKCQDSTCLAKWSMTENGLINETAPCLFPFEYKGRLYDTCTTAAHSESWCALSYVSKESKFPKTWGPCQSQCPGFVSKDTVTCRTESMAVCQFPFTYKDEIYTECTLQDHHKPWCATALDANGVVDSEWGNCRKDCPGYDSSMDRCLSSEGWPCLFPFEYQGQVFHACTSNSHDRLWCSVENHPNGTMRKWLECQHSKQCVDLLQQTTVKSDPPAGYGISIGILVLLLLISVAFNAFYIKRKRSDVLGSTYVPAEERNGILHEEDDEFPVGRSEQMFFVDLT